MLVISCEVSPALTVSTVSGKGALGTAVMIAVNGLLNRQCHGLYSPVLISYCEQTTQSFPKNTFTNARPLQLDQELQGSTAPIRARHPH